jgi:phage shock protein A
MLTSHTVPKPGGTIGGVRLRHLIERMDGRLERIDHHLEDASVQTARSNEVMARSNEVIEDMRDELRLSRADRERTRASTERLFAEMQTFMRDQTQRLDRVTTRIEHHLIANTRSLDKLTGAVLDNTDATKAHESTLGFILDELRGPPPDESPA